MKNQLITLVITMTVAIIVLGAVLAPVLSDAQNPQKTFSNETNSILNMDVAESADDTITIVIDKTTGAVTTNGETVTVTGSGTYRAIITDNLYVYLARGSSPSTGGIYQFTDSAAVYSFTGLSDDITITISGDTISFAYEISEEAKTLESTFTYVAYPSKDGEYVEKTTAEQIYANSVEDLYYASRENSTVLVYGHGASAILNGAEETATIATSEIPDIKNAITVSGITIPISGVDTTFSGNIVCKAEVIGDETYMDNVSTLLGVIPVLIIAALLVFAVRAFTNRD